MSLEVPADLPPVLADRRSMEEVFTNLVSNAINYSPDGGEVTVAGVSHGDYLEVMVRDTGHRHRPGGDPQNFRQILPGQDPKTRQVIGTGLGLSLVKGPGGGPPGHGGSGE